MGLLSRILAPFRSTLEDDILKKLVELANLSSTTCSMLIKMIESGDKNLVVRISKNERRGDDVRRSVEKLLFEGAFLPQSRPLFFTLAERMDSVIDSIEDCAKIFEAAQQVDEEVKRSVLHILDVTKEACDCFCDALVSFSRGDERRMQERIEKINELEARIDDVKHEVFKNLVKRDDDCFWREKCTEDLVDSAEEISDNIQDAADTLSVIAASMRV